MMSGSRRHRHGRDRFDRPARRCRAESCHAETPDEEWLGLRIRQMTSRQFSGRSSMTTSSANAAATFPANRASPSRSGARSHAACSHRCDCTCVRLAGRPRPLRQEDDLPAIGPCGERRQLRDCTRFHFAQRRPEILDAGDVLPETPDLPGRQRPSGPPLVAASGDSDVI